MKKIALLVMLAIIAVAIPVLAAQVKPAIGFQAPDGTVLDMQGKSYKVSEVIAKNKVTIVHFWKTWCGYCNEKMPDLYKLYEEYHSKGLEIVAVSTREPMTDLQNWITKNKPEIPVYREPQALLFDRYQVWSVPLSFIVDQNGIIQAIITNISSYQTYVDAITPLLEAK